MARINYVPTVVSKLEDFSSQLDGIKVQFVLTYRPKSGSLRVYWNGVLQPNSFHSIVNKTLTLIRKLKSDDSLFVEYAYED